MNEITQEMERERRDLRMYKARYLRRQLIRALPFVFIILSILCVFAYYGVLEESIFKEKIEHLRTQLEYWFSDSIIDPDGYKEVYDEVYKEINNELRFNQMLAGVLRTVEESKVYMKSINDDYGGLTEYLLINLAKDEIVYDSILLLLYLGIFLTAEAAFILMALKEYLQDVVGFTEIELITGANKEIV